MPSNASIGVFDSGIGGLTVVREMLSLMPSEDIVYLGDTARVPYGVRSAGTVKRYAHEGAGFLLAKDIKMLVVACNTVSAVGLDEIASMAGVPVLGVIEPGARAAAAATQSKKVGVIGTSATVGSGAYAEAISRVNADIDVRSTACPLFVPLVEEGWLQGEVPEMVARRYLNDISDGIDTLVLGCTHYPLLKPMLAEVMGPDIRLIDSARETAKEVRELLAADNLEKDTKGEGALSFFVTDSPDKFVEVGGSFLGSPIKNIEQIELEA